MLLKSKATKVIALLCIMALAITAIIPSGFVMPKVWAADGAGKIDVWDFAAEQLDSSIYNNKLTVDIINGWYDSSVTPGSTGVSIGSFETDDGELVFNGGGSSNHRIRGNNEAITRYDNRNAVTIDDATLNGYVYSNSSSTANVYLAIKLYAGDTLTVYTGSNGGASTITFEGPDGEVVDTAETSGAGAKNVFYATADGMYKLYTLNEKLVVYRALREHANSVKVSGSVSAPADLPSGYKVSFTNQKTGVVTEATVSDGKYEATLFDGFTYDLALVDAKGYIITGGSTVEVAKGSTGVTKDITVIKVDMVTVTGKITGIAADKLGNLALEFVSSNIYVPEIKIDGDEFTINLEKGVTYTVVESGVNDYTLKTTTISASADGTQDIVFEAKPVYDVTISYKGLSDAAKANASFVFTNIEDGYVYTFAAGEAIKLRDGQYIVLVKGYGADAVVQKLTSNLKVNGKAVSKTVEFVPIEVWDFVKYNGGKPGIEADKLHYLGLELKNANEHSVGISVSAGGEVKVPVTKGQLVTISYCYSADFEINGESYTTENSTGSTSKTDTIIVTAEADGYLTITVNATTYFTSISVATPIEYKAKVTVGTNKNYQTINDALAAVARMDRPNNERVEIVIDPGNYEEMLVINVPNVSLVNAAGKDSSLEIINKGVDIGKNVVRITSYYGTGYNYYSMGADSKWNADILAANQENGYLSNENAGDGTNNGSYWNATVVVMADGFEADGIVFENSFNQYISEKEAADTVVQWAVGGKGERPTTAGDTSVQNKSFVERAAALAIANYVEEAVFSNCKFIGRQDTLFGGTDVTAAFHKCDILGGTDFIFGPMIAVFYKCNLVLNTSEDKNDVAYITAAQQKSGRGYLMYECTITSTTPGVDTASATRSKPGYFGRPWLANTSEVVFFNTVIEDTDFAGSEGKSLINPEGWLSTLGGQSSKMYEYGTTEVSGEDNSASRASWSTLLEDAKIDGENILMSLFLGEWADELKERELLLEIVSEVDEATKVEVEYDEEAFAENVELNVTLETEEEDAEEFVYDISFVNEDGDAVQPMTEVTVKLSVPKAFENADKIYVYREEADGTFTDMKAEIDEDGNLVFSTDHFSKYIITTEVKGAEGEDPGTEDPGTEDPGTDDPDSPETGAEPIVPIAAAAIISAAVALFIIIKRRRTN